MRLFLGVLPDGPVLDHLDLAVAAARRVLGSDDAVRWSARDTWHLTAAFYGEVPTGAVEDLQLGLSAALGALAPYELQLRGAGVFAHRTLWVGVGGQTENHQRLVNAAEKAAADQGLWSDARERNRAHLTVGRAVAGTGRGRRRRGEPPPVPELVAQALSVYQGPVWEVSEVWLMRSEPGAGRSGGPLYTPVQPMALGEVE